MLCNDCLGRFAPGARWTKAEDLAASVAHATSPALSRIRLSDIGGVAGIAGLNGETGKDVQAAAKRTQGTMMRRQQWKNGDEIVRSRNNETKFFEEGFEIFFGALLAMKAGRFMGWLDAAGELANGDPVAFGFSHPLRGQRLHKGLSLWS